MFMFIGFLLWQMGDVIIKSKKKVCGHVSNLHSNPGHLIVFQVLVSEFGHSECKNMKQMDQRHWWLMRSSCADWKARCDTPTGSKWGKKILDIKHERSKSWSSRTDLQTKLMVRLIQGFINQRNGFRKKATTQEENHDVQLTNKRFRSNWVRLSVG